jgi:ketosteroid isomerase-like protein
MSEDNVELIKRGMALFNRRDWDAAIQFVAEDAVWTTFFSGVAGQKSRYGRADIRQSWEDAAAVLGGDTYQAEPQEFRDLGGGTMLVRVVLSGRGTSSGADVEAEYVQLWTIRHGLAVRVDSYATADEALEAVGLTE